MKNKSKKSIPDRIFIAVIFSVLVFYVLSLIYVLFFAFITSLKSAGDINPILGNNLFGFPNLSDDPNATSRNEFFKLANYIYVFENFNTTATVKYYSNGVLIDTDFFGNSTYRMPVTLVSSIFNTLLYCAISVGCKVFVTGVSAFLVAKYKYRFGKIIYSTLLVCMTVPLLASQAAELTLFRNLRIYSTWFQLILQSANFGGMYFFVFYAGFEGLPDTYLEAAEIDGASQMKTLLQIVLPLASKTFAAVGLILFVSAWNSYENILIYMPGYPTLSLMVYTFSLRTNIEFTQKCAACMVLALPVVILFVFFHKTLMGNVSLGGLKE